MGISSPSSETTVVVGVDATDDGKLERGVGFGDFERLSREASLCALS